jgi:Carboxypeptidase regulatory-like domain/TonB dependent receptor
MRLKSVQLSISSVCCQPTTSVGLQLNSFSENAMTVRSTFSGFRKVVTRTSLRFFGFTTILLVLAGLQAFSQEATIVGTVTDPSGAVVPNAKVTATNTETGVERTITTNESGQYVLPGLHIGRYNVKAEASGLKIAEQKDLVLQVGDRSRVDFAMQVGGATENISVEAAAVRVQTETGEVSNLITGNQLSNLAVNGTSLFQLAALAPGASNDITNYKDVPVGGDTSVSFNGQRTAHNVFMIDGGENYDRGCGGCVTTAPSSEAMAEFRQLTSNYSADYGLSSAGTITMVIKSGSSKFHGSAWENNRNDAFDARNFFFPAPNKKQELRMNIFGFNIGGPIIKNKTFFFYNMEWRRYIDGGSTNQKVPDPATYTGDFSSVSTPIMVPDATRVSPSVLFAKCPGGVAPANIVPGSQFPGNIIPSCMINPNATALLGTGFLPAPTTNIAEGIGNFVGGANSATNLKEEIVRIDHHFSDKFSVFGHFIAEQISQGYNTAQWSGDNLPTVGDTFNNPAYSYVIHATHTISPSLLNEIAFNYNGNRIHINPYAATGLQSLSLPDCPAGSVPCDFTNSRLFTGPNPMQRIPNIDFSGDSGAQFEISSWPWINSANGYQIRDDLSWTKGAHQLKMGGSWSLYKKQQQLFGTTQGALKFTGKANEGTFTGNSFSDFLLGLTCSGCDHGYEELAVQDVRTWPNVSWGAYVQDDWRATNRLTLNLGLRWDGIPHAYEVNDKMGNFYPSLYDPAQAAILDAQGNICSTGDPDPNCGGVQSPGVTTITTGPLAGVPLYLNGIGVAGKNGVPRGLVHNYWATFGPRLGFAYDLTGSGKTVVRGGFSVMYERIQGNDMYNAGPNIPFSLNVDVAGRELQNPNILLSTGAAPAFQTINPASITGLAINNYRPTASTQYSAGVQHSFGAKTVLSVAYVGNQNRHLNDYRNINLPSLSDLVTMNSPGASFGYTNAPSLPYKGFRTLSMAENEASGHYNSLQIDLNSQASKDLQLRAYYTLSRSIDPSTGGSGQDLNAVSNPYVGWRYDLGPSLYDRTHNFSANFIYSIPVLRNTSSRLMKSTLGGWQISGIVTIESGLPLNLTAGSGNQVGGGNRPDLNGKITYVHKVLAGNEQIQYFDTSVFSLPAPGSWGNLGHNALRGPGRDNWNLSLFKTFAIGESSGLQLRLETFNTFNHTQFQTVSNNLGDGDFGLFKSAYPARIVQLSGKIYF